MIIDAHERKLKSRRAPSIRRRTRAHDEHGTSEHRLLGLQRQLGNVAVTRLLQRDRAASTDAPWATKHGSHSKPKAPPKLPDVHARVIANRIDAGGKTVITIAAGPDQGVQV